MIVLPERPPARGFEGTGRAELFPRYEDVTQDGRVVLTTLMPGVGVSVWRELLAKTPAFERFLAQGILPILRRLVVVEGEPGPFSVNAPIGFEGTFRLAREEGGDRLFVNMWVDAFAPLGSTLGPPPPKDAPRVLAGRIFAEHVVTRPFAPPAERRVTRLDVPGIPEVPEDTHRFEPAEALVAGRTLERAAEIRFGMMHTDSNQHVNSLVYPRMFEEALVARHRDPALLVRGFDMRWRKPFFAGDDATLAVACDGESGAGTFAPASSADRASCAIVATLRRSS